LVSDNQDTPAREASNEMRTAPARSGLGAPAADLRARSPVGTRPGTPGSMRDVNRTLVLSAVQRLGPLSRAELVRLTSISGPTISAIALELITDGLVCEVGEGVSGGGRRPRLLSIDDAVAFVGCDLSSARTVRLVLVNLARAMSDPQDVKYGAREATPEGIADKVADYVEEVSARRPELRIRGIGVGAPGVTDSGAGIIRWTPTLAWREVPFAHILRTRIGLPVVVDNDVNLALLGEIDQGAAQDARHAVLIAFSEGIGGAVLLDGNLYRGRAAAGEVGALVTGPTREDEDLQQFGFTERRIADVLLDECQRRDIATDGLEREIAMLAGRLTQGGVMRLSARGRRKLTGLVSAAVASVAAVLDPETIVLSGWVERLGSEWLGDLQAAVAKLLPGPPPIRFSELNSRAVLVGAGLSASRLALEETHLVG
jgi:glucokinase